jgi:hypothetical protein
MYSSGKFFIFFSSLEDSLYPLRLEKINGVRLFRVGYLFFRDEYFLRLPPLFR